MPERDAPLTPDGARGIEPSRRPVGRREDFGWFTGITLRWNDLDVLGHVNNAVYMEFFDTTVLQYLHRLPEAGLGADRVRIVVAESGARYHRELVFSDVIEMGLRVDRIGRSSVTWGLAVFANGNALASADGHFVHVFTDPVSARPIPIPDDIRAQLARLLTATGTNP